MKSIYFMRRREPVHRGNSSDIEGIYIPELNTTICRALRGDFIRRLFLAMDEYQDDIQAGLQGCLQGNPTTEDRYTTKGQYGLTTDMYIGVKEFESDEAVVKQLVQDLETAMNLEEKIHSDVYDFFRVAKSVADN